MAATHVLSTMKAGIVCMTNRGGYKPRQHMPPLLVQQDMDDLLGSSLCCVQHQEVCNGHSEPEVAPSGAACSASCAPPCEPAGVEKRSIDWELREAGCRRVFGGGQMPAQQGWKTFPDLLGCQGAAATDRPAARAGGRTAVGLKLVDAVTEALAVEAAVEAGRTVPRGMPWQAAFSTDPATPGLGVGTPPSTGSLPQQPSKFDAPLLPTQAALLSGGAPPAAGGCYSLPSILDQLLPARVPSPSRSLEPAPSAVPYPAFARSTGLQPTEAEQLPAPPPGLEAPTSPPGLEAARLCGSEPAKKGSATPRADASGAPASSPASPELALPDEHLSSVEGLEVGCRPPAEVSPVQGPSSCGSTHSKERPFTCRFVFTGWDLERHEDFELVPRLIGRGGKHMQDIAKACDGKVRLRGRGSGHWEHRRGDKAREEANVPLQIALSCKDEGLYEEGIRRLESLLSSISTHFGRYCKKKGFLPAPKLYSVVECE